ncbi:class I SAM-dependent DNA methyltransferase [Aquabacterium sp.]|uniref:class I SAM-dependent DNA methyltransferase n=1 Tax=Aquabacterium sp. TaxID=1872578 RepID=UPI002E351EF8|nr:class I SAM-dependent DNA methyltransferase [Aquabacterium sp.]HEX5311122.1 class I SAM-dependent DNA methyltransferase [Aquabacterium sp.]
MNATEQKFFEDLEKKLWTAADKLRSSLDAAVYKHVVLGLLFLKYVSDAFEERQQELDKQFRDPAHDYYMDPADYPDDYEANVAAELEVRDYYTEKNVFWVPFEARWQTLRDCAQLPPKAALPWNKPGKDEPEEMRTVGWLIDNAMEAVERENSKLKNVLNKDFARTQIDSHKLADLIAHFSDTNFTQPTYNGQALSLKSKDVLGHVYEYFLGQFALAEGKKGGQYYTPKSIVTLIVEMLQPFKGRVYDPAMGSGGFFVQSEEFIEQHSDKAAKQGKASKTSQISVYGQESNPTTWKLAAMNMAIRGLDFNFGGQPGDTLLNDLHPDLRADYVMANPPFNMKEWWNAKLENDPRWLAGTPPQGNANFAWLQHMLYHLAPAGSMALLLANGSMSSNTNNEGEIRKTLVERDFVECMVALPGQLFTNTQIPACIWFLTKDKANGFNLDKKKRDRRGQFLFIDARQLGYMKDRVLRDFTLDDIQKVADTFHAWQHGEGYADVPGFCYSASLDDIRKHEHVLTPGRYVGTEEQQEDGEAFADKMARLTAQLAEQFGESAKLEGEIKKNLAGLGYEF